MKKILSIILVVFFLVPLFAGGRKEDTVTDPFASITYADGTSFAEEYNNEVYEEVVLEEPAESIVDFTSESLAQASKTSITDELKEMANKLVAETAGKSKPSYAFISLTTDYKNTLVDNYVTDALIEAMFNTGKIKIIERANLEAILEEQKFQSSGLVNEENVKSIGMIAGADFVCYGTLKDLGASLTVNARVVDVESGELCAISRATITKDDYLRKQAQSAVSSTKTNTSTTSAKTTTTTTPKTTTSAANNAWKVISYKDDFEGWTQYIFIADSTDEKKMFVSYKKCKNAADRVIAGIYWGYDDTPDRKVNNRWTYYTKNEGTYEIKGQTGNVVTKELSSWADKTGIYNAEQYKMYLDQSKKTFFYFAWDPNSGSRWLVDIIVNSDNVAIRRDGLTRRFPTAGLLDKMAEYGITWEEIDAALANEEF